LGDYRPALAGTAAQYGKPVKSGEAVLRDDERIGIALYWPDKDSNS
jgi:hypothetical protein